MPTVERRRKVVVSHILLEPSLPRGGRLAMKVRATSPLFEPTETDAYITSRHPRSCYGNVVLVIDGPDGGAVGPREAAFADYEVIEATREERYRLILAGYRLKGLADTLLH
jgi:hypothetical protein